MIVKELINKLQQCNQELPVFVYVNEDIRAVVFVDNSISDRIDINVDENEDVNYG